MQFQRRRGRPAEHDVPDLRAAPVNRIEKLLDPGSFEELNTFVRHRTHEFELDKRRPYGDAVVTGYGTIDGKVDPESERRQLERLKEWKANRNQAEVDARLADLRKVAEGDGNLLPPIKEALREGASIGDVCNAMRDVFGEYRGGAFF